MEHEHVVSAAKFRFGRSFPRRHREVSAQQRDATDEFRAWAESIHAAAKANQFILVCGPRGRGKTQLVTDIAHERAEQGLGSEYVRMADFAARFRFDCYGPNAKTSEDRFLTEWGNYPLLVLDEMQDLSASEFAATLLTRLVDRRYAEAVPTVMVTNLMPNEFRTMVGASVASRLEGGLVIEMTGTNYRKGPQ